nr:hypothetical protein OG999_11175 [Streptomyces sp. NBC_00886]
MIEIHGEIDIAAAVRNMPDLEAATATAGRTVVVDLSPVSMRPPGNCEWESRGS